MRICSPTAVLRPRRLSCQTPASRSPHTYDQLALCPSLSNVISYLSKILMDPLLPPPAPDGPLPLLVISKHSKVLWYMQMWNVLKLSWHKHDKQYKGTKCALLQIPSFLKVFQLLNINPFSFFKHNIPLASKLWIYHQCHCPPAAAFEWLKHSLN